MRAFIGGFVKGILGCVAVLFMGFMVCYFGGLLDGIGGKNRETVETAAISSALESGQVGGALAGAPGIGNALPQEEKDLNEQQENQTEGGKDESAVISLDGREEMEAGDVETGEEIRILFGGDLLLTESLQGKYRQSGIGAAASEELLSYLQTADIFMVNQEFPFGVTGEPMEDKQYTFRVPPEYVSLVKELGVDVVTLANNHMLDFGRSPLSETLETLDEAGIERVGAGENLEEASKLKIISVKGKQIGFLGASRVIPVGSWNAGSQQSGLFTTYDPTLLVQKIQEAKEICDFVAVYVHWGVEYQQMPEEYQRELARAYIDAGADAVIGSHPHVLQGLEYYQGKPVCYSLGNFIFSNGNYETMMVELTLTQEDCQVRVIPCVSYQNQMGFLEHTAELYRQIESISFDLRIDEEGRVIP